MSSTKDGKISFESVRYIYPNLSFAFISYCSTHGISYQSMFLSHSFFPVAKLVFFTADHLFRHRNLKRALQLANIVADSRYQLYEDFVNEDGKRLGDYLGAVREAILGGLEGGGSDPFRVIASA